jgi:aryl-alcohol dehydrogenase-like predicted oxidoreductase
VNSSTFDIAGQPIGRVGFGAMQLPGPGVMGPPRDRDQALAVLRRVIDAGVNHIDTAQYYGPDVSNELIREALSPYPDNLVIVSKVGAERDAGGGWIPAQRPEKLRSGVEDNLRSLGVDHLGAVNLRLLDHPAPPAERATLEDQLAEMSALRDEGKIIGIGISTATLDQVRQAHESVGLACVQNAYSLLSRDDQPVLDYCVQNDIAYVPYFPLGSAFPGMPKVTDDPAVQALAGEKGATPAQIGLAWLLGRAPNVCLIPGTSSLAHLEENLAVADLELSTDETDRLARALA